MTRYRLMASTKVERKLTDKINRISGHVHACPRKE
ncbi:MAG: hypothetical protein BMS9Abin18_0562 [Zetaproteobacteria bacterium]|nr:MAG: hypothetical protein BMS9Abin18_0562 [Zetaproteobacteria bacterium]